MKRLSGIIGKQFIRLIKGVDRRRKERRLSKAPFYKKYQYHSKLSILHADRRGAIELEGRFFYNRVPKSGNTTVMLALGKICGKGAIGGDHVKSLFMRPSEMKFRQVVEFDDFFKFTFVRDPYARVLSAYLDEVATGEKAHLIISGDSKNNSLSFRRFCEYLNSGGLYVNAHWGPQTSLMLLPIDQYDFIGRVEKMDNDLRVVVDRLSPETVLAPTDFRHPTRAVPRVASEVMETYYDDQCRQIVQSLYHSDFDCFSYAM